MLLILRIISRLKTSQLWAHFRARLCFNLYPHHYSKAFAYANLLLPHSHRHLLRCAFPKEGAVWGYHVPLNKPIGLGSFYSPAVLSSVKAKVDNSLSGLLYLLVRAYQHFWLLKFSRRLYKSSHYINHTIHP